MVLITSPLHARGQQKISSSERAPQTVDGGAVKLLDLGTSGSQQMDTSWPGLLALQGHKVPERGDALMQQ